MVIRARPNLKNSKGQIRIIAGEWRGRKIEVLTEAGLRPTGDRIRETLFNWLQNEINSLTGLDLFAGTGALGFEALSRGAKHIDFVEIHPAMCKQLQHNIALLKANAEVYSHTALEFLADKPEKTYDLVFIDPPFNANLWQSSFAALEAADCLKNGAWIYVESPKGIEVICPEDWQIYRSKIQGAVQFTLYQYVAN